ncbi:MAG: serine hydrolase [Proteobacteria bacterium]|nr:serine hydrolase [Pseudomonadota bacterium]
MKRKMLTVSALVLNLLCSNALVAQNLGIASPQSVGMSGSALEAATARLQQHIDEGDIAGVVAAVARDGKLVYFEALGRLNLEQALPMREDALFRIYSMARQITSTAALLLYEQGKFQFDDPVKMYLPEFADQPVLINPDSTDLSQTRERVGDMTVAHLLTHTSGLGSRSSRLYRENNVRDRNITLDQMVKNAAGVPLFHDPGTQFLYGIHATIIGKLIEVWSGQSFEVFLKEQLLDPLQMDSTMFWAAGDDAERLAVVYRPTDGRLLPYQIENFPFTARPRLIEGGVGLLSSVMDFMHFSQMILDGGMFNDRRILRQETVELMFGNAVPDQAMPIGTSGYWLGSGWTLGGFNLVMDTSAYNFPVSTGTIWWDGSAGTRYFIDPAQNTVIVIMAQVSPSSGGGFRENFSRLVDAAILERR